MDLHSPPLTEGSPFYSYHAFLFPFKWNYKKKLPELLEEQTDLSRISQLMGQFSEKWERRQTWAKPKSIVQYNEVVYFYNFVRPAIYDTGEPDSLQLHYYYRMPAAKGKNQYIIELADGKEYFLDIDDIVISYFNSGVGYLAFSLYNRRADQSAPSDVLTINAMGRRIMPPFFSIPKDLVGQQAFFEAADWKSALTETQKDNQLAARISLMSNGSEWVKEDFGGWLDNQDPAREPGLVRKLFPESLFDEISLEPLLDDRMFTVCWYGNSELIKQLNAKGTETSYESGEWWYQYVFVDVGSATCRDKEMRAKLLREATNPRWAAEGTLYGISRYSFVALTDQFNTSSFAKVICSHIQTIYYKVALLTLMQRACLLRFSQEVTAISELTKGNKNIAPRVSSLYKIYIRFVNKVYFREVTAQEQGIELYDTLQQQMRIEKHVKDLEVEIQELHQYVSILEEEEQNKKLKILTYIGALFVVPSFIGTYFGIGGCDLKIHWPGISVLSALSVLLAFCIILSKGARRGIFLVLLILLILFTLISPGIVL